MRPELASLPRSGLLHRLDKDTSGLLLVAKTLPAHTHLTRALQERRITREYGAIVNGVDDSRWRRRRAASGGTGSIARAWR